MGDMFDIGVTKYTHISYNYLHKLPLIPIITSLGRRVYFIVKNLRLSFSDVAMVTKDDD